MADRFYTPDPLPPGEYTLAGPDAHHLLAVRRFGPGDALTLFNGDGHDYPATVVGGDRKRVVLAVGPPLSVDRERPAEVVIASAVPKGDRADFLVEKLTELGVAGLIPLVCTRSVVVPKPATLEKFRRGVVEASKQCGRNRLMVIDAAHTWPELLARADLPAARFLLHTDPAGVVPYSAPYGAWVVAVGPEGGFTPGEVEAARMVGWQVVTLGPRMLRVETAAVAAAAY